MAGDGGQQGCTTGGREDPVDEDTIRAAIGALFFVLLVVYVVGTIKRVLDA